MSTTSTTPDDFGLDRALDAKEAIEKDRLNRSGFARQLINALKPLSPRSSIVVSIEGAWGSGKSSILAMAEELLENEPDKPLVVHFNPWLIGDRNALLQQFLSSLCNGLKLVDTSDVARRVAEEIEKYSAILDLGKFIPVPGAGTAAKVGKTIFGALARGLKRSSAPELHNIEAQKRKVEEALKNFPKRVVVLIDDVDRLYPSEVFEIIRIIKAVADLPNVGYILAYDASYVTAALTALHVPKASSYLDKIVQTRLAVPVLSSGAKQELMLTGFHRLPAEATRSYFTTDQSLLASVYHSGLRDMLEQPRDFARLYNVVNALEPELRGEIVLADIIGLAALTTKAPPVFELLRRSPKAFVGRLPNEFFTLEPDEAIKSYNEERSEAYAQTNSPEAVKRLVHYLFPRVAQAEGTRHIIEASNAKGRLAHSARLVVALQFALTGADVSFRQMRRFFDDPLSVDDTATNLTQDNCQDFLELLAQSLDDYSNLTNEQAHDVAVGIARLVECAPFVEARRSRSNVLQVPAQNTAIWAIQEIASKRGEAFIHQLAKDITCDTVALTVAADLALAAQDDSSSENKFQLPEQALAQYRDKFAENVDLAISNGKFFGKLNPGFILWCLSSAVPQKCAQTMSVLREAEPSLDNFALAFFSSAFDSTKGQRYAIPSSIERLTAFESLEVLEQHANERLADPSVQYPVRAAWRCLVERKSIYGVDGSYANE